MKIPIYYHALLDKHYVVSTAPFWLTTPEPAIDDLTDTSTPKGPAKLNTPHIRTDIEHTKPVEHTPEPTTPLKRPGLTVTDPIQTKRSKLGGPSKPGSLFADDSNERTLRQFIPEPQL
jgi:hypothetical protein